MRLLRSVSDNSAQTRPLNSGVESSVSDVLLLDAHSQAVVNATDRVNASVVHINVLQDRASSKQPASDGQQRMGSGSGFDCRILPGISSSVPGTAVHSLREELLHRHETHASQMNRLKAPFRCQAANRSSFSSLKLRWRFKDRLFIRSEKNLY
jgi:hypothetical protein